MNADARISLKVNGTSHSLAVSDDEPLLYVLRGDLGLNGAKFGCGLAQCGSCMVLVDGVPVKSCVTRAASVAGSDVTTLEGLGADGALDSLQQAFLDEQAGQCGYCIPGMIVAAAALLRATPQPTDQEVRGALDRNLCRCGAHNRIVRAVLRAARSRS